MTNWNSIAAKIIPSVFRLKIVEGKFSTFHPDIIVATNNTEGSAFVLDAKRQICITNAHVVSNAVSISGRRDRTIDPNQKAFPVKVLVICHERDFALCYVDVDFPLDDYIECNLGGLHDIVLGLAVLTLGYPLGNYDIHLSTGVIAGLDSRDDLKAYNEAKPAVMSISAPINPGSSGGCLISKTGKILGMTSGGIPGRQNIGYAINLITILSVSAMFAEIIAQPKRLDCPIIGLCPRLSIEFNNTDDVLLQVIGKTTTSGIYISHIAPDSCLPIEETKTNPAIGVGSILHELSFSSDHKVKGLSGTGQISNNGNVKVSLSTGYQIELTLKEYVLIIPYGAKLNIIHTTNKLKSTSQAQFLRRDVYLRPRAYPGLCPIDYEVIGGYCFTELTENSISTKIPPWLSLYEPYLIINQVPIVATNLDNIVSGVVLDTINKVSVRTLKQLRHLVNSLKSKMEHMIMTDMRGNIALLGGSSE